MSGVTISRDAGDKSKGFRLQKLRAIELLLDSMQKSDTAQVFVAIEHYEDVYVEKVCESKIEAYMEQDKCYNPDKAFTLANHEIKNTLVSFLDCWINRGMSDEVSFGFYTNIKMGKENQTQDLTDAEIKVPTKPVLQLLQDFDLDDPDLLPLVKHVILEEYKRQYDDIDAPGHYDTIAAFDDDIWNNFLRKISWKFDQEDEQLLKTTLIEKIKASRFYNANLNGKENHIIALAEQLFDERQKQKDLIKKGVHVAELKNFFLEVRVGEYTNDDPAYEMWKHLPPVTDKRNLKDKILSVCPECSNMKIEGLSRKVVSSKIEQVSFPNQKEVSALKYQIYDSCKDTIDEFIDKNSTSQIDQRELDEFLEYLCKKAIAHIKDKSKDYKYGLQSDAAIKAMVFELFDSCYLALDKERIV